MCSRYKPGQQRYSQFTNTEGGILDDLMITRLGLSGHEHWIYLVVNAACKDADFAHMSAHLPAGVTLKIADGLALIAVQGPKAVAAVARLAPAVASLVFMTSMDTEVAGIWCHVSRTGYTGEDGVEISVKNEDVARLTAKLLEDETIKPIGLGARDSLRLEAGLCLYGHDIDTTTSPVEGGLTWSIQKRRRLEGGFPGAARIQAEIANGASRVRVGLLPEGKAPAREGCEIVDPASGSVVGKVVSGGYGPSVGGPIAMGYVPKALSAPGTALHLMVRGRPLPAAVVRLPFVPNRYHRS
jgi:aminomethyltransferase